MSQLFYKNQVRNNSAIIYHKTSGPKLSPCAVIFLYNILSIGKILGEVSIACHFSNIKTDLCRYPCNVLFQILILYRKKYSAIIFTFLIMKWKTTAFMCKEDTTRILIRTYIYSFWKIVILFLTFYFGSMYYCISYCLFSWRSTSNSTRIISFEWNRIYHLLPISFLCLFLFCLPFICVSFNHWIHPTLIFCGGVVPCYQRDGRDEVWLIVSSLVRVSSGSHWCCHWKPHSSTSGRIAAAGQLR